MDAVLGMNLEPGIRQWVEAGEVIAAELPDLASLHISRRRSAMVALSDRLASSFTAAVPDDVAIGDETISTERGGVLMRWYRPAGVPAAAPTMVYAHGGAFFSGSVHELVNDRLLANRARAAAIQIASVSYRLAPEHPYPAGVDDVMAVVRAIAANPRGFDTDGERLGLGGTSAGAAIVMSAALRLRDEGGPRLIHQMLEVPPAAWRLVGESGERFAHGFGLEEFDLLHAMYFSAGKDAYAEPLDFADLSGLAPTSVLVAEYDPLRDGGVALARQLSEAGVAAELYWGTGHLHASMSATAVSDNARHWQNQCAGSLAVGYATGAVV